MSNFPRCESGIDKLLLAYECQCFISSLLLLLYYYSAIIIIYLSLLELGHRSGFEGSQGILGEVHVSQVGTTVHGLRMHEGDVVAGEHEHGEGGEIGDVVGGQFVDLKGSVSPP